MKSKLHEEIYLWSNEFVSKKKSDFSNENMKWQDLYYKLKDTIFVEEKLYFYLQKRKIKAEGRIIKKTHASFIEINYYASNDEKMNTLIHELAHHVCGHLKDKLLTSAQQEFVVDTIAEAIVYFLTHKKYSDYKTNNQKWEQLNYRYNWIKNARISEKSICEMKKQITEGYEKICTYL